MDNTTTSTSHRRLQTLPKPQPSHGGAPPFPDEQLDDAGYDDGDSFSEKPGAEVWDTLTENFRRVQSVLDRNTELIQQVNENHRSRTEGNLVKNVALIQEINDNMSKAVSLYSDLSVNFSTMIHQRKGTVDSKNSIRKEDSISKRTASAA